MKDQINTLKNTAKNILEKINIETLAGEEKILQILQDMANGNIQGDYELNINTLNNIENYLYTKAKMIIQEKDYEYLKKIAEILRNQKVRKEDKHPFGSPIFTVPIDEEDKNKHFDFMTREGAENYIESNSTTLEHLPTKEEHIDGEERRKINLFDIENNTNLEIENILEIIKRNY